jgi:Response regulator containing a CheY-like receiver domain and an HTH DNA-binding domain
MNTQINIVIADTQFLVSETLRNILVHNEGIASVKVVVSKHELFKTLGQENYGLLITDPVLFDFDGTDDLKYIKYKFPQLSVLILTSCVGKAEFNEFSRIGIRNIIYKTADKNEVVSAVDAAIKGKKYYSEEILDLILELNETKALLPEEPAHLTTSEIEIVRLISGGLTTKEIANQKNISFHTVNTHRKNIFRKMGVTNASELIMHAIKAGWIDNIEYFI